MDVCVSKSKGASENGKTVGDRGRRRYSNEIKDVRRKLSFMHKRINDLHHQRRFAYRNSVKVKKMIHNQVNQIVKSLRARERSLWCDVDEVYISQDAAISDELSELQSAHARCQVLFNHLDDCRGYENVLSKLYCILSQVNFGEKPETKPLEFISEFEEMKSKAVNYGHLDGDIPKKDFDLIADKIDFGFSNVVCNPFPDLKEYSNQTIPASKLDLAASNNYSSNILPCKDDDIEDSFQMIDLFEDLRVGPEKDNYMYAVVDYSQEIKPETPVCESLNKSWELCNSSILEASKSNKFNPKEEWKQIMEVNKKIADSKEIFKPHEYTIKHDIHNDIAECENTKDKLNNYKHNRFILLKEADKWLYKVNSSNDKKFGCFNYTTKSGSPAELIQKAFKRYLAKDNSKNWLSSK